MREYTERLKKKFYSNTDHPYKVYSNIIRQYVKKDDLIVDAGCGHEAPGLTKLSDVSKNLIGLDLTNFSKRDTRNGFSLVRNDISDICIKDNMVDVVISRSVLEHLSDPFKVFFEVYRILKKPGYFIFLTPNIGDYSSIIAKLIPNRFHASIVSKTEGRNIEDTFSTYYRSNSLKSIKRYSEKLGFNIEYSEYLGQYPTYFTFNPVLFLFASAYDRLICKHDFLKILRGWILVVLQK